MPIEQTFKWPEDKRAALSFSFDDARPSQVEIGIPLLDSYDVKATFYVSIPPLAERSDQWKEAIASGHEIGNHTFNHPCSGNFRWARQNALENYTLESMKADLLKANREINTLLGVTPATFAYPCGQTFVGRGRETYSYVPLVAELFSAGRGYQDETANDPCFCDTAQLMGIPSDNVNFAQIKPFLKEIITRGDWLILAGHEINKDGPQTTHIALLQEMIETIQADGHIWIAPVQTVVEQINQQRYIT